MAQMVPSISEDILQLNILWKMEYQGLYFGITMDRDLFFVEMAWDTSMIFGISIGMISFNGRKLESDTPFMRPIMIMGKVIGVLQIFP